MITEHIEFVIEGNNKKKIKALENRIKELFGATIPIKSIMENTHKKYWNNKYFPHKKWTCLLHEDSKIEDNIIELMMDYMDESDTSIIYLPLIVLENAKNKGVLNSCIWNSNLAMEVGGLDHSLALKQIDTTLYGASIPSSLFYDAQYYHETLEYYQHFYFLNAITMQEHLTVKGIPKIFGSISTDLSFEGVETEIKINNFKLAQEVFKEKEKLHIV